MDMPRESITLPWIAPTCNLRRRNCVAKWPTLKPGIARYMKFWQSAVLVFRSTRTARRWMASPKATGREHPEVVVEHADNNSIQLGRGGVLRQEQVRPAPLWSIARDFGNESNAVVHSGRLGDRKQARVWRQYQARQGAVLVDPGRGGEQRSSRSTRSEHWRIPRTC